MLRMSFYSEPSFRLAGTYWGYAYTYQEINKHLQNFKYKGEEVAIDLNSPKSKVQLAYGFPSNHFYPHQYKIQMTQWESSICPPWWKDYECDEWWTANQFGKKSMIARGIPEEKIYVYEHGVDGKMWFPKMRGQGNKVRFLHVDSGSPRKRADLALKAFKEAFGDSDKHELILKYSHKKQSSENWFDQDTLENYGEWVDVNVRHIDENLEIEELVNLFHFCDVLIYPSEGEGFGLIPLQALATGMPVISAGIWCSYTKYLLGNEIKSTLGQSPIQENYIRYGDVVLADFDSTVELMKNAAENIQDQAKAFYNQIPEVISEYDWQKKTDEAFTALFDRLGESMFDSYTGYMDKIESKSIKTKKGFLQRIIKK